MNDDQPKPSAKQEAAAPGPKPTPPQSGPSEAPDSLSFPPASDATTSTSAKLDYELLRLIGRGAYGEVWLARDKAGAYRAVKVIFRESFEHDRPYEREYDGIRKFEPVSRSYENQVQILHVGRHDEMGRFYYIMELGDDQHTGQRIDPRVYEPKTIKSELKNRGRFPVEECLRIGAALTGALENLHQHGLIHRDIKPGNIIFVNGVPKLADIGLVTDRDVTVSYVGTEGYIPPEGPSSAQADVFSLGKVLYEMATGRDRMDFPELPTDLEELPGRETLLELNAIIAKACERDPRKRYRSAQKMFEALARVQQGKPVRRDKVIRQRLAVAAMVSGLAALLGLILFGAHHSWKMPTTRSQQAKGGRQLAEPNGLSSAAQEAPAPFPPTSVPDVSLASDMVWIPPGTFTMGSPADEKDRWATEGPQTQVTISKGFWMSKYEVSQGQYWTVMGNNPSHFKGDLQRPVEAMTWHQAVEYCTKLTARESAAGRLPASYAYRLPTEAEWEYACRTGTTTRFHYGDDPNYTDLGQYAWYSGNSENQTQPVGLKQPNKWGLYDMHGNVFEWCSDYWQDSLPGGSVTDPAGPASGAERVIRGGSWTWAGNGCRTAVRNNFRPRVSGNLGIGFRPVLAAVHLAGLTPTPPPKKLSPSPNTPVREPVPANTANERPPSAGEGWRTIFDGTNLSGWKVSNPNYWSVSNGLLVGMCDNRPTAETQAMETQKEYRHFILEVEARWSGKGGTGFLVPREWASVVQIGYHASVERDVTGSARHFPQGFGPSAQGSGKVKPADWNILTIEATESRFDVLINGGGFCAVGLGAATAPIGLLNVTGSGPGQVEIRRIRVKELP